MRKAIYCGLLAAVVVVGLAFRLARLDARPMHHDEANQAVKFGLLLETGEYRYDKADHHGPTLYYLTLPSAWLRGQRTLAALDETTVRLVPALFGAGLLLLLGLLPIADRVGSGFSRIDAAPLFAALLAAVSPALTYYGRFYIQETVFTFFTLAFLVALGRYARRPSLTAALLAGASAGLAIATKETWVIVLPAALAACAVASFPVLPARRGAHLAAALGVALALTVLFYSSFFTDPAGLGAWIRSFSIYGARGLNGGAHQQPWWYYLRLLAWSHQDGATWSEGLILGLAIVGGGFAAARRTAFWPRYLAVYSLLTLAVFAWLPYKTPWNLLPFYIGIVALAGYGGDRLVRAAGRPALRAAVVVALAAGVGQLALQDWRANTRYAADPRNPYAYVHTSPDFVRLAQRVADVAATHPDGRRMLVKVIAGPYDQWPLPWYLRRMERVGYWSRPDAAGALDGVPVIVASQENAAALDAILGDRYVSEFYGLRPGVLLAVYVERHAWDRFIASRTRTTTPATN